MNPELIKNWLQKKKSWGAVATCSFGALALVAGIFLLFFTFWFTYAVIWIAWPGLSALSDLTIGKKLHLSHEARLICSSVFIVLLFIQHFRTSPWHWGDYGHVNYAHPGLTAHAGVMGAFAVVLANPGASANLIADILLSGPRLVTGSWKLWRTGMNLRRMDVSGCAPLIAFLATRINTVPYEELRTAGWEDWLDHLRLIEGVVFLEKGIKLSDDLRSELIGLHKDQNYATL